MSNEEIMALTGAILVIVGFIVHRTKTKTDDAIFDRIKSIFDKIGKK